MSRYHVLGMFITRSFWALMIFVINRSGKGLLPNSTLGTHLNEISVNIFGIWIMNYDCVLEIAIILSMPNWLKHKCWILMSSALYYCRLYRWVVHIDGSAHECSNSIALELSLSWAKSSTSLKCILMIVWSTHTPHPPLFTTSMSLCQRDATPVR